MRKFFLNIVMISSVIFANTSASDEQKSEGIKMNEFVLVGKMTAKPGCADLLEKQLKELSEGTYTESGCLIYALHRDMNDPNVFVLIEGWKSKEALDTHTKTPHFLKHFPILLSLIDGEPQLTFLQTLSEGPKGKIY